jgi:glutathione synthase/RimK-type ligase-like ATP-grasp enzyme
LAKTALPQKPKAKTTPKPSTKPKSFLIVHKAKTAASKLHTLWKLLGKKTINSSQIEFVCYSKLRTLLHLYKAGIPIPKTCLFPATQPT